MTEVRKLTNGSFGLFATQSYKKGDIVLTEFPLLQNANEDIDIQSQFSDSSFRSNKSSSKYAHAKKMNPSQSSQNINGKQGQVPMTSNMRIGKWRGMIKIAASYALAFQCPNKESEEQKNELLSLYHPSTTCKCNDAEWEIVQLAQSAMEYCINYSNPGSSLSALIKNETTKMEIYKIMLIWACNAFEGGLLYKYSCRMNHSCDPNCVIVEEKGKGGMNSSASNVALQKNAQIVKAVCCISPGDELLISYLGVFNWTGGIARQRRLLQTKHFLCTCSRCSSKDIASSIPCPSCHVRHGPGNKYLDENVQWDDDDNFTVSYAYPKNSSCDTVSYRCETCNESTQFTTSPVLKIGKKVIDKVLHHLENQNLRKPTKMGHEEMSSVNYEIDEQLHQLSSSVLGANHWATNLMLLSILDHMLASFHAVMLLGQNLPDMSELAEAIDSLQRLWKYSSGLKLKMDPSFLLYNQTLGISRALVALGDVKSMKYGAEWAKKVEDYSEMFEGEDMRKVVSSLLGAWERPIEDSSKKESSTMDFEEDDSNRSKKRIKSDVS